MSDTVKKHIELLGIKASDKVTGFSGVITSVSFDLYGCIQAVVTPEASEGNYNSGQWFDVTRLSIHPDRASVMDIPDFSAGYVAEGNKGAADKPLP